MILRIPQQGSARASLTASLLALVVLGGWSTAHGAAGFVERCGSDVSDLTSLDVSQDSLAVKQVDHVSNDADATSLDYLNAHSDDDGISENSDGKAPILSLTPRVADLLRNVFDAAAGERAGAARDEFPSSPLADAVKEKEGQVERDQALPKINAEEEILPRFQQQMYRKDI